MTGTTERLSSLRTIGTFAAGRACSDTLFHVLNRAYGEEPQIAEERAIQPLAGGILQHGHQCGMLWGSSLAAGLRAYRLLGAGAQAEARTVAASARIVDAFREQNAHTDCVDITGLNEHSTKREMTSYFFLKGGIVGCFRMAARWAPVAAEQIDRALVHAPPEVPEAPVSCAAELARRMGATDQQATMVSGWAGGIGLSGGGCGALGACIWLRGLKEPQGKDPYHAAYGKEAIERVRQVTGGELTCLKIAGRRFHRLEDHAEFLREGGCAAVLEVLAPARA